MTAIRMAAAALCGLLLVLPAGAERSVRVQMADEGFLLHAGGPSESGIRVEGEPRLLAQPQPGREELPVNASGHLVLRPTSLLGNSLAVSFNTLRSADGGFLLVSDYALARMDRGVEPLPAEPTAVAIDWRHDLSPRWVSLMEASHEREGGPDAAYDLDVVLGTGYYLLKNRKTELLVGVAGQFAREEDALSSRNETRAGLVQDVRYHVLPGLSLRGQLSGFVDPQDAESFALEVKAGVEGRVGAGLRFGVLYGFERENSVELERAETEARLTTRIGYSF